MSRKAADILATVTFNFLVPVKLGFFKKKLFLFFLTGYDEEEVRREQMAGRV